jgi:hypothetical protein
MIPLSFVRSKGGFIFFQPGEVHFVNYPAARQLAPALSFWKMPNTDKNHD